MKKYVLVQCCPVPAKLAPTLEVILHESGATLQSCYRADDVKDLLAQCNKHSQTWLYIHQGTKEQPNPANPPGQSTHELRSDGVAYVGPKGRRLIWWQVGIDIDDAHVQAFIRAAAKHGYIVTITYPGSRSEYHHVNFRKQPKIVLPPLLFGSRGMRVFVLKQRLRKLGYLTGPKQNGFTHVVSNAVVQFQKDHQQKADGIVGPQTAAQIVVAVRRFNKKRK